MSSFRNFGISFIAALLILGGVAYWAMGIVATLFDERRNQNESAQDDVKVEEYKDPQLNAGITPIKNGRSFNMVIIGIDEYTEGTPSYGSGDQLTVPKRGQATTILFVRFDKETRSIIMSSIPETTLVTVDYVTMTLGQAYGYRGAEYVKEKVSALTGMTIDSASFFQARNLPPTPPPSPPTRPSPFPLTLQRLPPQSCPPRPLKRDRSSETPTTSTLFYTTETIPCSKSICATRWYRTSFYRSSRK